ncbi:thymidine phosphorylase [Terracidiphilus gabretensis]|uniref:thymidine phosphorylase n=1 Tax=Terracidiphilus gabretensis TaxID=1577687 RepID=UPI00071BC9FC|nr:thymidine phosphorylase [Terracidiphilus gabretensis]
MSSSTETPLHAVDLIRKKRDGETLTAREIQFLVTGAATGSIPQEQLTAWLMAVWLRGLGLDEVRALTLAMRDSGEKFDPHSLGKVAVDKHSTGGVGDKTSFLVAPLAAACGVAVPMISGRALGHTGGTLDKLESIPGFRTALSLAEFESVLRKCGASIVSQTPKLVPADRVLYALRDRTATVENAGLICASILSKKLAAGLDALVLDVKTGSGAFLRNYKDAEFLAALMVATAEAAGTRTVALLTDMGQPLGYTAGNWIEIAECITLLRGERPSASEDLRELSLILAGWMIHLGGHAPSAEAGYRSAERALAKGSALTAFLKMIEAQGGDLSVFNDLKASHKPAATTVLAAWDSGYIAEMDTTAIGWAVQRTGAGREKAGEPVDPNAGIEFHAKRCAHIEKGQPFATLYGTSRAHLAEAEALLRSAIHFSHELPPATPQLVSRIFTAENAQARLIAVGSGT